MAGQHLHLHFSCFNYLIVATLFIVSLIIIDQGDASNDVVVGGFGSSGTSNARLNVRRVLLPINTGVPTNYTLEVVDAGCQIW